MRPLIALSFALLISATAPVASAQTAKSAGSGATQEAPKLTAYQNDIMEAVRLAMSGQSAEALTRLEPLIAAPAFKELPDEGQYQIFVLQAALYQELRRSTQALTVYRRLTAMPQADDDAWIGRASAATIAGDYADAAQVVMEFAERGAEALDVFNDDYILRLASIYLPDSPEGISQQNRLIDALFNASWDAEASSLWRVRATRLLDAGDPARAALMAEKITATDDRLAVSVDRRFDVLREAAPSAFDVVGALDAELERKRAAAHAVDAALDEKSSYARALMYRGRYEEALVEINASLDRSTAKADAPDPDPNHLIWALDSRARILGFMGRHDEALADLRRASRRPENGGQNVSQAINLAWLYHRLGRDEEALEAIADIDDANLAAYGKMQRRQVQACAEHALGRDDAYKISVAWLREHQVDNPAALESVAKCAGDLTSGAAAYLARLEDPERRGDALAEAQTYIPSPNPLPSDERARAYGLAMLARPDVKAAIERYGRIETWPLTGRQF